MSAFSNLNSPLILFPLPVASCRSRDPSGAFLKAVKGAQRRSEPFTALRKVPGFTSEQHETRRVGETAPLPRAEKKRALLILKKPPKATYFAFSARRARALGIVTRKGQDKSLIWLGLRSK